MIVGTDNLVSLKNFYSLRDKLQPCHPMHIIRKHQCQKQFTFSIVSAFNFCQATPLTKYFNDKLLPYYSSPTDVNAHYAIIHTATFLYS